MADLTSTSCFDEAANLLSKKNVTDKQMQKADRWIRMGEKLSDTGK